MIEVFERGEDIHRYRPVINDAIGQSNKEMRYAAKAVNFGDYGMGLRFAWRTKCLNGRRKNL